MKLVARDADGRPVEIVSSRPLILPAGRCLTDIWGQLTPRKRVRWVALVEEEAARVTEAATRARAANSLPPMDMPALLAAWHAHVDGTDQETRMPARLTRTERLNLLDRLDAAGAAWAHAREWALGTGQWLERDVEDVNAGVVDAYLAEHAPGVRLGSRFDELLADPGFWAEVAAQCEDFGPQAPPGYAEALARLGEGARALLALVDGRDGGDLAAH